VLISVGLLILVAGLVLLASGSVRSTKLEQVASSFKSWEVSGNLTSGNTYVVDIYASTTWEEDWTAAEGYTTAQPVGVTITLPDGGEVANFTVANFTALFNGTVGIREGNYSEPGPVTYVQTVYNSVNSTYLSVGTSTLPVACFRVLKGGNYTARVINGTLLNIWASGPPAEMLFEEEITLNPSSFTNLLEGSGVACLVTGVVVSVGAFRASKGKKIKRKSTRAKS
jgi:hypothetical protein